VVNGLWQVALRPRASKRRRLLVIHEMPLVTDEHSVSPMKERTDCLRCP
jgi:hypothetical protein